MRLPGCGANKVGPIHTILNSAGGNTADFYSTKGFMMRIKSDFFKKDNRLQIAGRNAGLGSMFGRK